jgi:hypothetical protein
MHHEEATTKKKESAYAQWMLSEDQVMGGLKEMIQMAANGMLEDEANNGLLPANEYGEDDYEMTNLGNQGLQQQAVLSWLVRTSSWSRLAGTGRRRRSLSTIQEPRGWCKRLGMEGNGAQACPGTASPG